MKNPLKIQIIIGSTRQGRVADKPAQYIFDELKKREGVEPELVDLRDWPLPFFDEAMGPSMLKGNYSNELGKKWAAKVGEADAYIVIAPEYNHGYTAVLKNALDWVFPEWNGKAIGFVGYGSAGGARSIEQLRQVVIELKMHPIRASIHLPIAVYMAIMKEQVPANPELFKPLREGTWGDPVEAFFIELIDLAKVLKTAKE
jgi:NAD(P)H-dependent FMN reductase